jgi:hypothetical protein
LVSDRAFGTTVRTSGYRLFRVCSTGPYVESFRAFLRRERGRSYADTLQRCREAGFLYPGSLAARLEAHGVEVMEAIVDAAPLQRTWLAEQGAPVRGPVDLGDVFLRQLRAFRPDVVYFQTFFALAPAVRRAIRDACPSVRLVVGHRGFPLRDCGDYGDVDAVFLGYPRFHQRWHAAGVRTFFLPHCFDEAMLPAIERRAREIAPIDFSFVGTTGWGYGPHGGRYYDLRRVLEATPLTVCGNEPTASHSLDGVATTGARAQARRLGMAVLRRMPRPGLAILHRLGRTAHLRALRDAAAAADPRPPGAGATHAWYRAEKPLAQLFPERVRAPRFGVDYCAQLAASRLTWNRHLEMEGAGANMRLFEACGVGTCQLVDALDEVLDAYEPDREIVTYRSIDECIEKARWLLDHPADCARIGRAGQARTLRDHTVGERAARLHHDLASLLA